MAVLKHRGEPVGRVEVAALAAPPQQAQALWTPGQNVSNVYYSQSLTPATYTSAASNVSGILPAGVGG